MKCKMCEDYGRAVRLVGGVWTTLCEKHRWEWDAFCDTLSEFRELVRATGMCQIALAGITGGQVTPDEGQEIFDKAQWVADAMRAKARAWLEGETT